MKINIAKARACTGSRYPKPFEEPCQNKTRRRLGNSPGLTQFGVNRLELDPAPGPVSKFCRLHAFRSKASQETLH
jgi:uncharacterized cupin superfamily protein